jgi:hypothetical protein
VNGDPVVLPVCAFAVAATVLPRGVADLFPPEAILLEVAVAVFVAAELLLLLGQLLLERR